MFLVSFFKISHFVLIIKSLRTIFYLVQNVLSGEKSEAVNLTFPEQHGLKGEMIQTHIYRGIRFQVLGILVQCFSEQRLCVCVLSQPAEAAQGADHFHPDAAGHPGVAVCQDALPGHLHAGGGGAENQPARVQSAGEKVSHETEGHDHVHA